MILVKTDLGQQALKNRAGIPMSFGQRQAFILFNGQRSVDEVLATGLGVKRDELDDLVVRGLLRPASGLASNAFRFDVAPPQPPSAAPNREPAPVLNARVDAVRTAAQKYQDAYPIATRLTASLGLRGFRLNLAVEASSTTEQLQALVPKIRAAVGADRARELEQALGS